MERRAIAIQGTVQGVGFRPFVFGLASRLNLRGFVHNSSGGVRIEVEGESPRLDQFLSDLTSDLPPLARIDGLVWERRPPLGEDDFRIEQSRIEPGGPVVISPDVATCDACLAELFNPSDRRYRYPFLNCTNCGPRLTIVRSAPYDRERTTMACFLMCAACRAEYENPADRRFHAQPTACPICGPRLMAANARGETIAIDDPLRWFADALRAGRIGAMKGLGGYHLACDARSDTAVSEMRRRKHREEKAFGLMVRDVAAAEALCELSPLEQRLLTSSSRPIVLLRRRRAAGEVAEAVAPGNPFLGIMLPYTPLHHLLMEAVEGMPLVMTSGNKCDEPIACSEPDIFHRLEGIADLFLFHDRPIHVRCDDSVTRVAGGMESPLRRSRGYAPQPIRLPVACADQILAVGGQLKGTFALGRETRAILSHHLGDLDHFEAFCAFEKDVALYEELFAIRPRWIAHDLHPDYASTRYAQERAAKEGIRLVPVQHHHAHMASCMAEHGLDEPVIGVSFDGTGFGTDGRIWGGEFLVGDLGSFSRAAHFRYVGMPGGERAVREPWRMALAHLSDSQVDCPAFRGRIDSRSFQVVQRMLERGLNTPLTSSVGRLFDAVASLIGLRDQVSFEGQAAMQLEWIADRQPQQTPYSFEIESDPARDDSPMLIDTRPMIRELVDEVCRSTAPPTIAGRFHVTLAEIIVEICRRLRDKTGISNVVLSGGVFMNALLAKATEKSLKINQFCPFRQKRVPCNDGGLSLGQLAIASKKIDSDAPR